MASITIKRATPNHLKSALVAKLSDGRGIGFEIRTGISVLSRHWGKKGVLSADPEAIEKNDALKHFKKKVLRLYLTAKSEGIVVNAAYIRQQLKEAQPTPFASETLPPVSASDISIQNAADDDNVLAQIQRFIDMPNSCSESYMRGAHQLKQHLTRFVDRKHIAVLPFHQLTHFFLSEYNHYLEHNDNDQYLHKGREYKKIKLSSATRAKHFEFLSKIAKLQAGQTFRIHSAVFEFGVTEVNRKARHLTWKELNRLMDVEVSGRIETLTKDIFLFMCFTGMRVTAAQELLNHDITGGFIHWVNTKSPKKPLISTTIHRYSAEIIRTYRSTKGKLFPYIPQADMNVTIKQLAKRAMIERPHDIKCHTGRHSYNNLLETLGIETFIRNEELGHSHGNVNEDVYTGKKAQQRKTLIVDVFERVEDILAVRSKQETTLFDDL
ncbi:MAG: phage integrase SAM-like domain-containing protein [Bacteroidota bacterium]